MKWQPISTAPKDGTRFLAWVPPTTMGFGVVDFYHWQTAEGGRVEGWRDSFIYVSREGEGPTHWMPVPAGPDEEPTTWARG